MTHPHRNYDKNYQNAEIIKLEAEIAKLKQLLSECYSAISAMSMSNSATVPEGLGPRIREAIQWRAY